MRGETLNTAKNICGEELQHFFMLDSDNSRVQQESCAGLLLWHGGGASGEEDELGDAGGFDQIKGEGEGKPYMLLDSDNKVIDTIFHCFEKRAILQAWPDQCAHFKKILPFSKKYK